MSEFFVIFFLFQVIRGWEVSIADFGSRGQGSIPQLGQLFLTLRNLFLFCGERLFSAIFKMGFLISVPYVKLEKKWVWKIKSRKKKKMQMIGFEPLTSWFKVQRSTTELYFLQQNRASKLQVNQSEGCVIITGSHAKSHGK